MTLIELLQDPAPPFAAVQGQYLLQGQHSRAGKAVAESFTNLNSAIIRASELIRAGYVIEIWSPASLESQLPFIPSPSNTNTKPGIAANMAAAKAALPRAS